MPKENEIRFNNLIMSLHFCVYDHDENDMDVNIKVTCQEDIEHCMKLYFEENWEELFEDKVPSIDDVHWATFQGIKLTAKENGHKFWGGIVSNTIFGLLRLNLDELSQENANKLAAIRQILE